MKLAALGLVTAVIGVALDIPGLLGIGAFWVVLGPLMRVYGQRIKKLQPPAPPGGPAQAGGKKPQPVIDGRTFAIGTLLWLLLGIPSIAVGVLQVGIPAEDEAWRWLPIVIGGLALGIGVIGAVLYLTGGALQAVGGAGSPTETPATIQIRAVRETGTYINDRPRLEFELTVEPDTVTEVPSYQVTKKATVPFTAMGSLRVGDGFRAMVAGPENPTAMDILWDQPVSGAPTTAAADPGPTDVSARLAALDRLRRDDLITVEEYEAQRERILGSL